MTLLHTKQGTREVSRKNEEMEELRTSNRGFEAEDEENGGAR
jgi:hypothetical protein